MRPCAASSPSRSALRRATSTLAAGATARIKRLMIAGDTATLSAALEKIAHRAKQLLSDEAESAMTARSSTARRSRRTCAARSAEVHRLRPRTRLVPGLAVVLVGDNPASEFYVRNKSKAVTAAGMRSVRPSSCRRRLQRGRAARPGRPRSMPTPTCTASWCSCRCRRRSTPQKVIAAIDPAKDVDGFHPLQCRPAGQRPAGLVPCTPLGCMRLAKTVHASLAGLEAVVIGRSNIVGKPVAQLLLAENATVTIAHSKTRDLPACAAARIC